MRRILLYVLALVFTAASFAPAAFAFECDMLNVPAQSESMSDMPCHDPENNNATDHCDGVCLCLSLSLAQNQIFENISVSKQNAVVGEHYTFTHAIMRSNSPLPLYKPPIEFS